MATDTTAATATATKMNVNKRFIDKDELTHALLSCDTDFPMTVTGSSMAPLMKDGRTNVILTKDFTPEKGRILLFKRCDGSLILHRVRKIKKDGTLIMNGDAQSWCEAISPEQALAAVKYLSIGNKQVKYDTPLLRLWDKLWYPTYPIRRWLFSLHRIFIGGIKIVGKRKK